MVVLFHVVQTLDWNCGGSQRQTEGWDGRKREGGKTRAKGRELLMRSANVCNFQEIQNNILTILPIGNDNTNFTVMIWGHGLTEGKEKPHNLSIAKR